MKITIIPNKKKVYIRGDLKDQTAEQIIEKVFEEVADYIIEVEPITYSYPVTKNNVTTTMGQAEG